MSIENLIASAVPLGEVTARRIDAICGVWMTADRRDGDDEI